LVSDAGVSRGGGHALNLSRGRRRAVDHRGVAEPVTKEHRMPPREPGLPPHTQQQKQQQQINKTRTGASHSKKQQYEGDTSHSK